jgi:hypothetical protein
MLQLVFEFRQQKIPSRMLNKVEKHGITVKMLYYLDFLDLDTCTRWIPYIETELSGINWRVSETILTLGAALDEPNASEATFICPLV